MPSARAEDEAAEGANSSVPNGSLKEVGRLDAEFSHL